MPPCGGRMELNVKNKEYSVWRAPATGLIIRAGMLLANGFMAMALIFLMVESFGLSIQNPEMLTRCLDGAVYDSIFCYIVTLVAAVVSEAAVRFGIAE